jgi:hypothetical protein
VWRWRCIIHDTKVTITGVQTNVTQDSSVGRTYSTDGYEGGKDWYTTTAEGGAVTSWGEAFFKSAVSGGSESGRTHTTGTVTATQTNATAVTNGHGSATGSMTDSKKTWYAGGKSQKEEKEWKITDRYTFRETDTVSHVNFTGANGDYRKSDTVEALRDQWGSQDKTAIHRIHFTGNWGETSFDLSVPIEGLLFMRSNYAARARTYSHQYESKVTSGDSTTTAKGASAAGSLAWVADVSKGVNVPGSALPGGATISFPAEVAAAIVTWPVWREWSDTSWSLSASETDTDTATTSAHSESASAHAEGRFGKLHTDGQTGEVTEWHASLYTSKGWSGPPSASWESVDISASYKRATKSGGVDSWDAYQDAWHHWSNDVSPNQTTEWTHYTIEEKSGNQLKYTVGGQQTVTTITFMTDPNDPYSTIGYSTGPQTSQWGPSVSYSPLPDVDWSMPDLAPMGTVEFYAQYSGAIASELAMFMMQNWQMFIPGFGMFGFFDTQWYSAQAMQGALNQTLSSDFQFQSVWEWASYNFVTTFVDHDRLLENRYGNEWLDNLAIAGLIATEITGYIDPTPISDSLNAGLRAAEGDYLGASISLAGAFIPGGGDKALKGAARVGQNAMEGMGRAGSRVGKEFSCAGSTRTGQWIGKNVFGTACFTAGHWIVVLDEEKAAMLAALGEQIAVAEQPEDEAGLSFGAWQSASIAGAVALVGVGLMVQETGYRRRKRQLEEDLLDDCFADWDNQDGDDDLPLSAAEPEGQDSDSSTWDDALMDVTWNESDGDHDSVLGQTGTDLNVAMLATPRARSREAASGNSPARQSWVTSKRVAREVRRTDTKRRRQPRRNRLWLAVTSVLAPRSCPGQPRAAARALMPPMSLRCFMFRGGYCGATPVICGPTSWKSSTQDSQMAF